MFSSITFVRLGVMKKYNVRNIVVSAVLAVILVLVVSCTAGRSVLSTHRVQEPDKGMAAGTYTLLLYSAQDTNYLGTVAVLDSEGDDYEIKPFGARFNYAVVSGVHTEQALETAKNFVKLHVLAAQIGQRAIQGPGGEIIGYELRPLHYPFVYGTDDLIDVSYILQAPGKVVFFVELKDSIKQEIIGGDGRLK
jgi:hypothetical protein